MNSARPLIPLAAVVAALCAAAPAAAAPPANDAFANATVIQAPSQTAGTTVDATREAGEPKHQAGTQSAWYTFTPAEDGAVQIDACADSSFDSVMTVYTGTELNGLSKVAGDDDSCGNAPRVTLQVKANTKYSIAVTGFASESSTTEPEGTFRLNLRPIAVPANDAFADAKRIVRAGRFTGSSTLATREFGEPRLSDEAASATVWFRYRARRNQRITLDTFGSNYDTVLGVYTGDLGRLRRVASNDDTSEGTASEVTINVVRGRTYHIVIDGYGTSGDYELGLSDGSAAGVGLEVEAEEGQSLDSILNRGLRAKLSCARPCRVDLRAMVSRTTARRMGLGKNRTLARTVGRLGGDDRELPAVLRLARRVRTKVGAQNRLAITIRAELLRTRHPDRLVSDRVLLRRLPAE